MAGGPCELLAYLEASSPPDQFAVIKAAHESRAVLYLLDGLDECAHVKPQIQEYAATTLAEQTSRVVLSSRLAGFSDEHLAEKYQFVQLELCNVAVQKMTAKRRLPAADFGRFETLMSEVRPASSASTCADDYDSSARSRRCRTRCSRSTRRRRSRSRCSSSSSATAGSAPPPPTRAPASRAR
jgi:hypothetical protein